MLTDNREFDEIYEDYKNLVLKAALHIRAITMWQKILLRIRFSNYIFITTT